MNFECFMILILNEINNIVLFLTILVILVIFNLIVNFFVTKNFKVIWLLYLLVIIIMFDLCVIMKTYIKRLVKAYEYV